MLNLAVKYQKLILALAFLALSGAMTFSFNDEGINLWVWRDYPTISLIAILFMLVCLLLWVQAERYKLDRRINEINQQAPTVQTSREKLLTGQQLEVLKLIQEGKTNKEICELLFVEISTVKSHINQIYKKLDIKTRKEARALK